MLPEVNKVISVASYGRLLDRRLFIPRTRYASSGVTHGLFFLPPNNFFTFDYPGSTFTSLNGINDRGIICGRYVASGIARGFLARVRGTPPTQPMGPEMKANDSRSLVVPLDQSVAAWGGVTPAR